MFGFVQSWFAPGQPDRRGLRQRQPADGAGRSRQPTASSAGRRRQRRRAGARPARPAGPADFFAETVRDLLGQRQVPRPQGDPRPPRGVDVHPAPADAQDGGRGLKKALPWEARGKLPIDPIARRCSGTSIAGEIYQEQEQKNEVILMAAARELVNQLLAAAAKAKLDVVGMNVEPKAIVDCFSHMYRRKTRRRRRCTLLRRHRAASATRAVHRPRAADPVRPRDPGRRRALQPRRRQRR